MRFKEAEIARLKSKSNSLNTMIEDYLSWAPNDDRGSDDYPTLQALKDAVDHAHFENVSKKLIVGRLPKIRLRYA